MHKLFMKNENVKLDNFTAEEVSEWFFAKSKLKFLGRKVLLSGIVLLIGLTCIILNSVGVKNPDKEEAFILSKLPLAEAAEKKDLISVPSGIVKANPFVPYRSLGNEVKEPTLVLDVPKFDLIDPPEKLGANSDAAKMMDTLVSGILFDKFSPSAILKINGTDYLVKKGDVVNNYKILAIAKDSVTVKMGNNTYKAGIGEILTEGELKHNEVSNLNKKFGGEPR